MLFVVHYVLPCDRIKDRMLHQCLSSLWYIACAPQGVGCACLLWPQPEVIKPGRMQYGGGSSTTADCRSSGCTLISFIPQNLFLARRTQGVAACLSAGTKHDNARARWTSTRRWAWCMTSGCRSCDCTLTLGAAAGRCSSWSVRRCASRSPTSARCRARTSNRSLSGRCNLRAASLLLACDSSNVTWALEPVRRCFGSLAPLPCHELIHVSMERKCVVAICCKSCIAVSHPSAMLIPTSDLLVDICPPVFSRRRAMPSNLQSYCDTAAVGELQWQGPRYRAVVQQKLMGRARWPGPGLPGVHRVRGHGGGGDDHDRDGAARFARGR